MINNKNGFTLLELLIAAALIGVLAMFATQAFRSSASDIRVADARARAQALAAAARNYYIEYPGAEFFDGDDLIGFAEPGSCDPTSTSPQQLINCGFLEYRQVAHETYEKKENEPRTVSGSFRMWFAFDELDDRDTVKVCFQGKGRRIFLDNCTYCANRDGFSKECPED